MWAATSSNWTALGVAMLAVLLFWTISATTSFSPFTRALPRLYNKRICLLIAHPDDEAMFFAPTVLALTKPELGNHLKILCFSTGNAAGLGETRKRELQKSAMQLGLRDESDVFIVDDPERFPDSMQAQWSETEIAFLLASAFAPELTGGQKYNGSSATSTATTTATISSSKQRKQKQQQAVQPPKHAQLHDGPAAATIDVLLTFDQHGISNHPNHRSLYHGAIHFLRELMKDQAGYTCPVTLYTLTSTSIFRKYVGVLDAPVTMVLGVWSNLASRFSSTKPKSKSASDAGPVRLLFVSSIGEWVTAQSAMVKGHASQMVWFRWGWITIGRYMTVNDLKRVKV
ncbi:hypothetical protein N7510_004143 [Penicillium lagena]|uniref:uncharacterized protein n=1 Tax=Penicillium lagena TaxID=94218 RepID=UPI002540C0F7|nr:uncharacterized protein N7510_004143 [Penicillium lagena]KAJ5620159.1 hypothetical protein N7510_004143 [Penicillium lagena]